MSSSDRDDYRKLTGLFLSNLAYDFVKQAAKGIPALAALGSITVGGIAVPIAVGAGLLAAWLTIDKSKKWTEAGTEQQLEQLYTLLKKQGDQQVTNQETLLKEIRANYSDLTIEHTAITERLRLLQNATYSAMGQLDDIQERVIDIQQVLNGDKELNQKITPIIEQLVRIFTAKLPVTGRDLFGRDEQLAELDEAWSDENCHILSFVAFGGVGKTALVNKWLNLMERDHWRGARRVYGWSFYSQGTTEDRQASGDTFIAHALEWFGDKETAESSKSPWDKGARLAELIRQEKTLLILDGLEPLQYPPGPMAGQLKDQGLQSLLRELSHGMNGLCVISTREKVEDLENSVDQTVKRVFLETLSPEAGMQVLRNAGVKKGTDKELKQASNDFGGHALALTLLGRYLAKRFKGEIKEKDKIPQLASKHIKQGEHAFKVMESYEIWLKDENPAELDVLYLMGLFDRPAEIEAVNILTTEPAIAGLTENLAGLSDEDWDFALINLRDIGLLAKEDDGSVLDCHPLVREHFGEKLKNEKQEAWKRAHKRLYEYYKNVPEKELPDTLEEMEPLFRAVFHGCAAGKYQEAFDEVYWERINRRDKFYSTSQLGAFGSLLGCVSCFFDSPWKKITNHLTGPAKAFMYNQAGFALRAVGRLREAAEPMKAGLEIPIKDEKWKNAAIAAGTLSELYLTIGDVVQAIEFAKKRVEYADKSGDASMRLRGKGQLGFALHYAGRIEEARKLIEQAEEIQREIEPEFPYLYSTGGYMYCDLLLGLGQVEEVKERAKQTLMYKDEGWYGLLSIALDQVSLGKAALREYSNAKKALDLGSGAGVTLMEAKEWLDAAVDGLRESGNQDEIPRGLFARAEMYRVTGDYKSAWRDVREAREIADRGGMGLWIVDVWLEEGRIYKAEGNLEKARECGETAKKLIEETGYHRRDGEAAELVGLTNDD